MSATVARRPAGALPLALRRAALGCCLALAPAMAVAHRSAVLTLTLAACLAAAAALAERRAPDLREACLRAASSPLGASVLAFLAFALLSTAWSPRPVASLRTLGEFALPVAAALTLAVTLPGSLPRSAPLLFAASLALAAALVIGDLASGLAVRRWAGLRAQSFVLNRPALTLLALLPAVAWLLRRAGRPWLAGALGILVAAAILRSDSGAAKLGLVAGSVAWLAATAAGRATTLLVAAGVLGALVLAPVTGEIAGAWLPEGLFRALASAHAQDRADIWAAFGSAIREAPLVGQGFGASAFLGSAAVAAALDPDHATLLAVGHPHSAAIQIWAELGAVGAALAGALAVLSIGALAAWPAERRAFGAALLAAAFAVSLVGHGAWQGWWPAAIGLALVLFRQGAAAAQEGSYGRA